MIGKWAGQTVSSYITRSARRIARNNAIITSIFACTTFFIITLLTSSVCSRIKPPFFAITLIFFYPVFIRASKTFRICVYASGTLVRTFSTNFVISILIITFLAFTLLCLIPIYIRAGNTLLSSSLTSIALK